MLVATRKIWEKKVWNPGMHHLPGSHEGWLGKSVCTLRWHSVPAGGRRSRRGDTRRDRRHTLRNSPSSSLVTWEDALQIAPAGKLFAPPDANTLWTKKKKRKQKCVWTHTKKNNKKPLFILYIGLGDQTPVLKTGTGTLVNVEIKQYIIQFKDMWAIVELYLPRLK